MTRIVSSTITILIVLAVVAGCPRTNPSMDVVATWNDGEITVDDLDGYLMKLPTGRRLPGEEVDQQTWLEDRTTDLFVRSVFGQDDVDVSTEPGYARALELGARAVLAGEFLRQQQTSFQVPDAEVRQFFEQNVDLLRRPERRAFLHIFIAANGPDDVEGACNEAAGLRKSILAGASFEETARLHSDSANAKTGGLVAPVTRAQLRPEIAAAVFSTPPGEMSRIIPSPTGCSLFKIAQVVPAIEPNFEDLADRILQKLVADRRGEWRNSLLEEQMSIEQLELPPWIAGGSAPPDPETDNEILIQVGDDVVTWSDLRTRVRNTGISTTESARDLTTELVFSRALKRADPHQADQLMETARNEAKIRFLSARAFREFTQTIPEEDLRHHWETHQTRFQSDLLVGLTLYSWPIAPGDPLESLKAPKSLANELRNRPTDAEAVWTSFSDDSGARRELIPETDLRTLATSRPTLSHVLMVQLAENDVVGPYRFGNRLWVAHVTRVVDSHPLSYDDAESLVRADFFASHGPELRASWRRLLVEAHDFTIISEHLENFGANLVKTLRGGTI